MANKTLFVGNLLAENVSDVELMAHFAAFDPHDAKVKGKYAFIEVPEDKVADAIDMLNGSNFKGNTISVSEKKGAANASNANAAKKKDETAKKDEPKDKTKDQPKPAEKKDGKESVKDINRAELMISVPVIAKTVAEQMAQGLLVPRGSPNPCIKIEADPQRADGTCTLNITTVKADEPVRIRSLSGDIYIGKDAPDELGRQFTKNSDGNMQLDLLIGFTIPSGKGIIEVIPAAGRAQKITYLIKKEFKAPQTPTTSTSGAKP